MEQKSRLTTLCYIENEGAYLVLHRIGKKNDVNKDKWIGVNGHFGGGGSPKDCPLREVKEEAGLTLTPWRFRGLVTFRTRGQDTEYMCLRTADKYEGEIITCNEGTLEWVKKGDVLPLSLWEGDRVLFKLLNENTPFFSPKLSCREDRLTEAVLNGKQVELFDALDEDGRKTGVVRERSLIRMDRVPHEAAHIWTMRKDGDKIYDLLLQKRNRGRDSCPGCYNIPSAGRVQAGDEFLPSTIREPKEELKIEARGEDLKLAGFHKGYMEGMFYESVFRDSEVSAVYMHGKTMGMNQPTLQKEEVGSAIQVELGRYVKAVRNHGIPNCIYLGELEVIERYLYRSQEKQQMTEYRERE